jgi:hypothetical protein
MYVSTVAVQMLTAPTSGAMLTEGGRKETAAV